MQSYIGSCHCGNISFEVEDDPTVSVNVRCPEGVDLDARPVRHFDGRKL